MIACYSKDISLIKCNQWVHLFHPNIYWFAWYKDNEGNVKWGVGTDKNHVTLKETMPLSVLDYAYIIDLGVWKHFEQKVQNKFDASVWVNLDNEDIRDANDKLYSISGFKQALKNMGISWTLTKCTKFFAMSKEEKMAEVKNLQKLIVDINTPLPEISSSLYETLMKKPIKFTITTPTYSWVLRNGVIIKETEACDATAVTPF